MLLCGMKRKCMLKVTNVEIIARMKTFALDGHNGLER